NNRPGIDAGMTFTHTHDWKHVTGIRIRAGYEMIYDFPQATPMIMVLGTHFTRASDVITPDFLTTTPPVPITP
ncbi:hypothetical protein QIG46_28745, partial [Klebsiella pneumoniae]|nr:hypothetical protein [Klebsiella pneumoniae]